MLLVRLSSHFYKPTTEDRGYKDSYQESPAVVKNFFSSISAAILRRNRDVLAKCACTFRQKALYLVLRVYFKLNGFYSKTLSQDPGQISMGKSVSGDNDELSRRSNFLDSIRHRPLQNETMLCYYWVPFDAYTKQFLGLLAKFTLRQMSLKRALIRFSSRYNVVGSSFTPMQINEQLEISTKSQRRKHKTSFRFFCKPVIYRGAFEYGKYKWWEMVQSSKYRHACYVVLPSLFL